MFFKNNSLAGKIIYKRHASSVSDDHITQLNYRFSEYASTRVLTVAKKPTFAILLSVCDFKRQEAFFLHKQQRFFNWSNKICSAVST